MTWWSKLTFLEDRYLEKWSLVSSNFSAWLVQYYSILGLKKPTLSGMKKTYPWNWLYLMSNAVNCRIFIVFAYFFKNVMSNLFNVFNLHKLDVSEKKHLNRFQWMELRSKPQVGPSHPGDTTSASSFFCQFKQAGYFSLNLLND